MALRIRGLVAATHTPFTANGDVNLSIIDRQMEGLVNDGAFGTFICGTTGECSSLTLDERMAIAERWLGAAKGTQMKVIVHVGSNCLADSKALAAHAEEHGAAAVGAVSPSYFKPKDVATLVECLAMVAAGCPETPFYFYDIPSLTNVTFSAADVLEQAAAKIPNLNGAKFTNPDLFNYQRCLMLQDGKFDVPYGIDEALLAAIALGGSGAVGSSYNFTAPLFRKVIDSTQRGDLAPARKGQRVGIELIAMLMSFNYLPASKLVMKYLGIDVGPTRLPLANLTVEQEKALRPKWDAMAKAVRAI